jgi:signal transduction histidine kinase
MRLTLLYGSMFLFLGAALLAVVYALVSFGIANDDTYRSVGRPPPRGVIIRSNASDGPVLRSNVPSGPESEQPARFPAPGDMSSPEVHALLAEQNSHLLDRLVRDSLLALGPMAAVALGLGWFMAGRALQPIESITASARGIASSNLQGRLGLNGPNDEVKELGDTIDGLLARLEAAYEPARLVKLDMAFQSQRRFVANASHELRTPLARQRTLIQVALSDPDASEATLRKALERVLASGAQEEQIIEALLTLSQGQSGLMRHDNFDLATLTEEVLLAREHEANAQGVTFEPQLSPAFVDGDRRLMERLITNLVENAIRYNRKGGFVRVRTTVEGGKAVLVVRNTGQVVPASEIERLLQPFQRLDAERSSRGDGLGLGLSIVQAIATAHGADFTVEPQDGGGLEIELRLDSPASTVAPEDSADFRSAFPQKAVPIQNPAP